VLEAARTTFPWENRTMSGVKDDLGARPVWYLPTVADMVFLVIVVVALRLGQTALLNDPGTPWHVKVGLAVWESGPPHTDTYSYTRGGEPWVSQAWLWDAVMAVLYRAWSWNGVVVAAALVLGLAYRSLFRFVLSAPANVAWAAGLTLLAAGCGSPHWLARSHLLSLWFMVLTFRWCVDFHRSGSRTIWAIPPLMALWSNVHGAFLAGLVVIGCSLLGQLLSVPRDSTWRQRVKGFGLVLVASVVATLVNPYGWKLHAHLGDLLFSSGLRDLIDEWRAPDFQAAESRPLEALLLLSIGLLAVGRRRISIFPLLHLVVWVHFGLLAVRQVAFAAVVAVPVLGELTFDLWPALRDQFGLGSRFRWVEEFGRRASEWAAIERAARWPIWTFVFGTLTVLLTALGISVPALGLGSARFSTTRWPAAAIERLNSEPTDGPLFNDLNWGGYLILHTDPPRAVFTDDRFELYGRDFLEKYLDALQYGPAWNELLERHHFELVLIRPDVPLARVLRESPAWEVLHADHVAILFRIRPPLRLASHESD
jgi:hypothetical protein